MAVKGLSFCPSLRTHLEQGLRAWPLLGAPWGLFRALVTEQATYLPRAPSRTSSWECPSRKILVNEKKKKILASQMLTIRVPNGYILKPSHSHCLNVRTGLVSSHTSGVAVSRLLHSEPCNLKQEAQMLPLKPGGPRRCGLCLDSVGTNPRARSRQLS